MNRIILNLTCLIGALTSGCGVAAFGTAANHTSTDISKTASGREVVTETRDSRGGVHRTREYYSDMEYERCIRRGIDHDTCAAETADPTKSRMLGIGYGAYGPVQGYPPSFPGRAFNENAALYAGSNPPQGAPATSASTEPPVLTQKQKEAIVERIKTDSKEIDKLKEKVELLQQNAGLTDGTKNPK